MPRFYDQISCTAILIIGSADDDNTNGVFDHVELSIKPVDTI